VSSTDKEERTHLRALRSEDMDDYKLEDIVDCKSTEPTGELQGSRNRRALPSNFERHRELRMSVVGKR
jgi:hypothetical protein